MVGLSLSCLSDDFISDPNYLSICAHIMQMANNNWKKNFKRKKKPKYGRNMQKDSLSYQRYQTQIANSTTSPDSRNALNDNRVESLSRPVLHLHVGDPPTVSPNPSSKEPPVPMFLVEAHPLWNAYSSVRESNPLSD